MAYLIWKSVKDPGVCTLMAPNAVKRSWQLNRGISRAADWSADTFCKMNDRYPKDISLSDNMHATGLTVVSSRVREFLEQEKIGNVEFLPLTIINHKGKPAADDYSIVNPLDVIDCIDQNASQVAWNPVKSDLIMSCSQLVLKADAVPDEVRVFRPKYMPMVILMDDELAAELSAQGFSGLSFKKPEEFTGT